MNHASFVRLAATALAAGAFAAGPAGAATFRWAAQNDILTLDPHAQNHADHARDPAARLRGPDALRRGTTRSSRRWPPSWKQVSPTQWRFNLRQQRQVPRRHAVHRRRRGVLVRRASSSRTARTARSTSPASSEVQQGRRPHGRVHPRRARARSCCATSIDCRIMSKAWAEKNNARQARRTTKSKEETFASRNANGTGPYMLKSLAARRSRPCSTTQPGLVGQARAATSTR